MMRTGSRGFTLLELLLVMALIGLFGSVFVLNVGSLMRDGDIESFEKQYWKAVEAARQGAVFRQTPHYLEWDKEERRFLVRSSGEQLVFPVQLQELQDAEVDAFFEEVAPENSYVLIAGQLVAKREIVTVGFFPDGTCSPYTVTLQVADFVSSFQMDPWTGVRLVNPEADEAAF